METQETWSDPLLDVSATTCPLALAAEGMLSSVVFLKKIAKQMFQV